MPNENQKIISQEPKSTLLTPNLELIKASFFFFFNYIKKLHIFSDAPSKVIALSPNRSHFS